MMKQIKQTRQGTFVLGTALLAVLVGLLSAGCGNNSSGNSNGNHNSVSNGGNPSGVHGNSPAEYADWPELPEGSEPGLLERGILGDVFGRVPPKIGAADALITPGETIEVPLTLGRGIGSTTIRGYGDEEIIVRNASTGEVVFRGRTDSNGQVVFQRKFPYAGNYFFEAEAADEVDGTEAKPAFFGVYVREKNAPLVISDIDLTLVSEDSPARVLLDVATPFDNSVAVLDRLVEERGWTPIYLTQRPDYVEPLSKGWLRRHGFPPGPVVPTNFQTLIQGSGPFKTQALRDLKSRFPNIKLAIGDKYSDSQAYVANEVPSILIPPIKWDEDDPAYWRTQMSELQQVPESVQVVQDWYEIEKVIFGGARYPVTNMLNMVRQRAR